MPLPTVPGTIIDQALHKLHVLIAAELRKYPPGFLLAVSPQPPQAPDSIASDVKNLPLDMAPIDPAHLPVILPNGWRLYGPLIEAELEREPTTESPGIH